MAYGGLTECILEPRNNWSFCRCTSQRRRVRVCARVSGCAEIKQFICNVGILSPLRKFQIKDWSSHLSIKLTPFLLLFSTIIGCCLSFISPLFLTNKQTDSIHCLIDFPALPSHSSFLIAFKLMWCQQHDGGVRADRLVFPTVPLLHKHSAEWNQADMPSQRTQAHTPFL